MALSKHAAELKAELLTDMLDGSTALPPSLSSVSCTFLPVIQYAVEVVVQMPLMGIDAQLPSHSF